MQVTKVLKLWNEQQAENEEEKEEEQQQRVLLVTFCRTREQKQLYTSFRDSPQQRRVRPFKTNYSTQITQIL
jgi:hypothetical protein